MWPLRIFKILIATCEGWMPWGKRGSAGYPRKDTAITFYRGSILVDKTYTHGVYHIYLARWDSPMVTYLAALINCRRLKLGIPQQVRFWSTTSACFCGCKEPERNPKSKGKDHHLTKKTIKLALLNWEHGMLRQWMPKWMSPTYITQCTQGKTGIVYRELTILSIDSATLQETRFSIRKTNYTFFWKGVWKDEIGIHWVTFALHNSLLEKKNQHTMRNI